jgi:hypothetical protein
MKCHQMIPEEIRNLKRWHNWRDINGTKIPLQVNGEPAKSNDPTTWTDFETADAFGPLAFELGFGYCGVDLDNCIDEDDNLRQWAWKIIDRFDGLAYAEISPSGRGIKLITRGQKPEGSRCVYKVGDDKQQLECYDRARFWTVTGNVYNRQKDIGDGQAALNWLCETYLTPVAPAPYVAPTVSSGFGLEQRAAAYVDNIPPAGPGGRNNTAFNIAGHLWAMVGDNGERLTADQVLSNMRAWNARNFEPLGDDELQRVTSSAGRNGTSRAEKPSQAMPVIPVDAGVDLSGILGQGRIPDEIKTAVEFPAECLTAPGLIGELVRHNLETALYPLPELALAGALALLSSVTGGKAEGLRARTNVYVMGLAPSGGGKDYSRKLNRKILLAAGGGHICGPERIGSHAGIISALAENWNTLFQIDEIGRMLATMQDAAKSPHLYNITSVLMQIYTSADDVWQADAYGDRKKCKTLEYPHCVVYGTSIPDGFWTSLSKENLSNGLIGRFLVFENQDYVDFQDVSEKPIPEKIIERCRSWLDHKTHSGNLAGHTNHEGASPQRIECDEQASDRLKKHAVDISLRRKQEDPVEAAIWSRHAEKTNKLALLFACSRWSQGEPWPVIRLQDADRAIALNNYLTRRMLKQAGVYVSESTFETIQLKVMRVIARREEWTQNELTRATRFLKPRERLEILQTLVESGEIEIEDRETGGRPVRVFRPKTS